MLVFRRDQLPVLSELREVGFALLISVILAFWFWWPLITGASFCWAGDWDQFIFYQAVPDVTVREYQQFPFWNPFYCGGLSLIGNPHNRIISPALLFTSAFGSQLGLAIEVVVHSVVGVMGMYALIRFFGGSGIPALTAGIIFVFSGHYVLHLSAGHVNWLGMAYLPLVFLFYLKGISQGRYLVFCALFFALMFLESAEYVFIFTGLFLVIFSLMHALQLRSWRPVVVLAPLFLLCGLICGPKLLPVMEVLSRYPVMREIGNPIPWKWLHGIFLSDQQFLYSRRLPPGWWEYGAYVGFLPVALFVFGFSLWRKHWPLLISAVFFFLLGMGNWSILSPWTILHNLPGFVSTRCPGRAFLVLIFIGALVSGLTLDSLEKKRLLKPRAMFFVLCFVFLAICVDLVRVNSPLVREVVTPFKVFISDFRKENGFKQIIMSDQQKFQLHGWSAMLPGFLYNQGVVNGYDPLPTGRTSVRGYHEKGYRGEYFLDEGKGNVRQTLWSPNKITFDVALTTKDILVVNQNYDRNWHSVPAGRVRDHGGLLAVDVVPADRQVELQYFPFKLLWGILMFAGGIILMLFWKRICGYARIDY